MIGIIDKNFLYLHHGIKINSFDSHLDNVEINKNENKKVVVDEEK